jgi:lipopolysaccharide transport system ATP-binding protein
VSDLAIRAQRLGKKYRLGTDLQTYSTVREALSRSGSGLLAKVQAAKSITPQAERSTANGEFWALTNANFEVNRGEVFGVIGRNGAGKSTLLKLLSRISEPTSGRIEIRGNVASLLEVGTGFHPELSGRENIFLNGAILGMSRHEMNRKFDQIVEFAEVERFIDTPVKRYSSGMYLRLAFSVAAHLDPDILLVDEVLAVGDADFQRKCLAKMDGVSKSGRTVVFVSHSMAAIQSLCTSVMLLDRGQVQAIGPTASVVEKYLNDVVARAATVSLLERTDRTGNGSVKFTGVYLENSVGQKVASVRSGDDCSLVLTYRTADGERRQKVWIGIHIEDNMGRSLIHHQNAYRNEVASLPCGEGTIRCTIPRIPLTPGRYGVGARIVIGHDEADWPQGPILYFDVEPGDFFKTGRQETGHSPVLVDGRWSASGKADDSE